MISKRRKRKIKKLDKGVPKYREGTVPVPPVLNSFFIDSKKAVFPIDNLIANSLRVANEVSRSLSLAMPNELLYRYNDTLNTQRYIFDQINICSEKLKLEVASVNNIVSNILAPASAAVTNIGLATVNANQLFELDKIGKLDLSSMQRLSELGLDTLRTQQEFIVSGLQAVKNLEDLNKFTIESVEPFRMITNGLSETVRSLPIFPHRIDLPSLKTIQDGGSITKDELTGFHEKLDNLLIEVDPKLVEFRKGCWAAFHNRGPNHMGQASSSLRRLFDTLLQRIAPDEKVIQTNYFRTSPNANKNGKPTRKARLYYATDYETKQAEHLKRLISWFLSVYDNLPAWDHQPIENDDFAHGIFIAIEGHILYLLSERRKDNKQI
jgi:hypothetical protein